MGVLDKVSCELRYCHSSAEVLAGAVEGLILVGFPDASHIKRLPKFVANKKLCLAKLFDYLDAWFSLLERLSHPIEKLEKGNAILQLRVSLLNFFT